MPRRETATLLLGVSGRHDGFSCESSAFRSLSQGHNNMSPLVVKAGEQIHSKNGMWRHDDIIGKRYGCKVSSKTGYFAYILHPTPELWTLCLPHRTQIIYTPDIRYAHQGRRS